MRRICQSLQGVSYQTQGTPLVAETMGVRVGLGVVVGVVVPVMPRMVTQPAVLSQSAILTLRLPHRHRLSGKKGRRTAPRAGHSLSQRPAPIVLDVDAASGLAPVTHLRSEGDFILTDTLIF